MAGYARPDIQYAGRVLPGDWTEASGGRIYARYIKEGGSAIRLLTGRDREGWHFKAEVCDSPDDPFWLPLGGSGAVFAGASQAKAAADEFMEGYFRDRMTAKRPGRGR